MLNTKSESTKLKEQGFLVCLFIAMTKTMKTSIYLFTQFYFGLFLAPRTGRNALLSFAPTWTAPKINNSWP